MPLRITGVDMINKLGFGFLRLPKRGDTYDWETLSAMVDCFMAGCGSRSICGLLRRDLNRDIKTGGQRVGAALLCCFHIVNAGENVARSKIPAGRVA